MPCRFPFRGVFLRLNYCIDGRRPADNALNWHIVCPGELALVAFMPAVAALIAFFPGSGLRFGLEGNVCSWANRRVSRGERFYGGSASNLTLIFRFDHVLLVLSESRFDEFLYSRRQLGFDYGRDLKTAEAFLSCHVSLGPNQPSQMITSFQ